MTAFTTLLAVLLAAVPSPRAEKERTEYEQSLLDELSAIAPAAVEDARQGSEAYVAGRWQEVIARYEAFETAGKASKIKPIGLEDMFKLYEKGKLAPVVN